MKLSELHGTSWVGQGELWLDPLGNTADTCECTISVTPSSIDYTWSHEGKPHTGKVTLTATGAVFQDTFHSSTPTTFTTVAKSWALLDVEGEYPAPEGPPWGWRIYLSRRPSGELVLQMLNITPWGEDGRAVRMVCKRA